ncbi:MAG: hypothetical protein OEY01_06590 [Desulfobulbaceae bacterium]|nr:hypothetical protein [Desulfobulbaceae bacterium]
MSKRVEPILSVVGKGHIVQVEGIPKKYNNHIFWLEKAVGIRYFLTLLGEKGYGLDIHTNHNMRLIRISLKDSSGSIQKFNFNSMQ